MFINKYRLNDMNIIRKLTSISSSSSGLYRNFSLTATNNANYSCKLLVVGGGSGGCTMAAKFARRLGKGKVIVLEPSSDHYYQPLWTLVGAGVKRVADTHKFEHAVLPAKAQWIKDHADTIHPDENKVTTRQGDVINYEYIIIAVGIINDYNKIPGLTEALQDPNSSVSTIYDPRYCEKTFGDLQKFKGGDAIFTYPDTLIKCPGAPQKITYLAESYFTKTKIRSKAQIHYNSSLPVIFGVKKYADVLLKVVERKKINVNYKTVLREVRHDKKEALFFKCDDNKIVTLPYDMLHVAPPMKTPDFINKNAALTDELGYLDVDKFTLQHTKYKNIYGIGDCTNTPNSKTAAAIAKQGYVVEHNLLSSMSRSEPKTAYDGYGACPLVTSYSTCIMAEFLYGGVVRETFPFDQVTSFDRVSQSAESRIAYQMKKELFPFIYWNFMLKGRYNGPEWVRKIFNPRAK